MSGSSGTATTATNGDSRLWETCELTTAAMQALEERGIDAETLGRLGVLSVAQRTDWVAFPFVKDGRWVNTKYRTFRGGKRFAQDKGGERVFYNVDALSDPTLREQPVIIVEGEIDCAAALQAGFPRTVSVPDGAPNKPEDEPGAHRYPHLTDDVLTHLREAPAVILAVDDDGPGWNLRDELAMRIGKARCKWVHYPDGCKDLGDVVRTLGNDAVERVIDGASWLPVTGIYRMSEIPPGSEEHNYQPGIAILDEHWRIRKGSFSVITGIPGHGKSALAHDVIFHMARNHGWRWGLAIFEQRLDTSLKREMRSWYHGKLQKHMSHEEIAEADAWIEDHFQVVKAGPDDDVTFPWLLEKYATLSVRWGLDGVLVDPWNEIEHVRPAGTTETDYICECFRHLRKFRERHNVHVIVVTHPAKMHRNRDGDYPVPTLYDIAGSAHWANKCDVGVVVYRTKKDIAQVYINKCKEQPDQGMPGLIPMYFSAHTCRFTAAEDLMALGEVDA